MTPAELAPYNAAIRLGVQYIPAPGSVIECPGPGVRYRVTGVYDARGSIDASERTANFLISAELMGPHNGTTWSRPILPLPFFFQFLEGRPLWCCERTKPLGPVTEFSFDDFGTESTAYADPFLGEG